MNDKMDLIKSCLRAMYPGEYERVFQQVRALIEEKWKKKPFPSYPWIDQGDLLMISYGDALRREGEAPLKTLKEFLDEEFRGCVSLVHLLPMFPYSSDDGFSVIDYREIDPALGSWEDIGKLGAAYGLVFDAVINHVSRKSRYFAAFVSGDPACKDFFITADPKADYSLVTRPRALPLLTPVETAEGTKHLWTTFSEDQIDLNYKNPRVLLEMLDILLLYACRGARFIRFDAIGFAWKELGTSCMHLPQVHQMVKLMRAVLQSCAPGCSIITETNVPHKDNVSYFGKGDDEAAMVYQFPLPPLTLFSFLTGDASRLSDWAAGLEPSVPGTAYFNFLASHDGIGLRPVEGLLSGEERDLLVKECLARGGEIGYRTLPDGSRDPYELNINYLDAIAADVEDDEARARKFMASQCVLLSMMGLPAVYYHSLVGSRGDREGYIQSGIKRRINREKLDFPRLRSELGDPASLRGLVASRYKALIRLRRELSAFHPNSPQQVLRLGAEVFALLRGRESERVLALVNVSGRALSIDTGFSGRDLVSGEDCGPRLEMEGWQYRWIRIR
ncbi:MAG: sugar phosphorylase [Treponema sp.]|jgi:sucrose phosphorylase|nr:sugar phosphorylase [Treponema sp.]